MGQDTISAGPAARRRWLAGAASLLLAAGLAGCASAPQHAADWPEDYRDRHPIKVAYSGKGGATVVANRCGAWPDDGTRSWDNRSYYNFGCAYQRNIAAMVEDPRDLVSPRATTPPYATRRQGVVQTYGRGEPTATQYPESDSSISQVAR